MRPTGYEFKVALDTFSGPLDLLLYLVRREEVDIFDIPIARITEEYLRYLDLMSEMNVEMAGEFLVMAATLMEIKSRMMAPQPEPLEEDQEPEDPRLELVRRLMEYRRFKEAAVELARRAEERAERFGRPGERVQEEHAPAAAPGVTIWALLDAFSRVLEQTGARGPHRVVLEEIPQERLERELEERVRGAGRMTFMEVFRGRTSRALLIGLFLALLELARRGAIRVVQEEPFGEIWVSHVPPEERPRTEAPAETADPSAARP